MPPPRQFGSATTSSAQTGETQPIETMQPAAEPDEAATVEPAATMDEEREWDVVEQRYRDRPAPQAESALLNSARETWDLPEPQHPASPDEDVLAA